MKKTDIFDLIRLFLAPILVIALGLLLLLNPDSASALIAKLLGWLMIAIGGGFAIAALVGAQGRTGKVIGAAVFFAAGMFLTRNPLALAAWLGRLVGVLLLIDGIQDMFQARKLGQQFLMPLIVVLLGAVLVLMPMTTSRLVFSLCGAIVLIVGVAMLLDRIRHRRLPGGDHDPNIIDV